MVESEGDQGREAKEGGRGSGMEGEGKEGERREGRKGGREEEPECEIIVKIRPQNLV